MPKEKAHADTWIETTLPDGGRMFSSRYFQNRPDERGSLILWLDGKVGVLASGPTFDEPDKRSQYDKQKRRIISRIKCDGNLVDFLERVLEEPFPFMEVSPNLLAPVPDLIPPTILPAVLVQVLRAMVGTSEAVQFEKSLDLWCGSIRAVHELRTNRYLTRSGKQFIAALQELVAKYNRPPTKGEIAKYLLYKYILRSAPVRTSEWCSEYGFNWLPSEPSGRKD